MEGVWWAIGAQFALVTLLFGWVWKSKDDAAQANEETLAALAKAKEDLAKAQADSCREFGERITRLEITMEPWRDIMMKAVPQILNLHHSPDVLADAFEGEPDPEKLEAAEARVSEEWAADPPGDRKLALLLAMWLLRVRRNELELARKGGT